MIVTQTKYYCDECWTRKIKTEAIWGWAVREQVSKFKAEHSIGHSCHGCFPNVKAKALKVWKVKKSIFKH